MIGKLLRDFFGIAQVAGPVRALQWAGAVAVTLPSALRTRNLLAADAAMGTGPFVARHGRAKARLVGDQAFSGLREIWVRQVYSRDDFLKIPDHGVVVDLGANMGNFSALALASNPTARVVAVEPGAHNVAKFHETMRANGFQNRATLHRAFVGIFSPQQVSDVATDPNYTDAERVSEADFLAQHGIDRIAFLKCDIEGSEYFLTDPQSRLLDISDRVGIEIHAFGGDVKGFLAELERRGFRLENVIWDGEDCIALAVRD
ncbi:MULTISPECIES: FkbM family methyltransferase [unclassified Sphingomonas]|uniref:FkbM family methyltransferase n=1 Tax=unclassified Sphingomonas TaxID=196159 RepID=UPI000834B212|nr:MULTISPECIES: FkbM family methyltransferase [unclassified Sphingomonas]